MKVKLILVALFVGAMHTGAYAQEVTGTPSYPGANNHGGWNNPNHGGTIGGCNKDKTWCWNINVDPPKRGLPIEVYGGAARNLIARGEITHANMSGYGVFYLNVWSRYYNRSFDCDVNVSRRTYHCVENW